MSIKLDMYRWRAVDLQTTRRIARFCSAGADWAGSGKRDIIESMDEKTTHFTVHPRKFRAMMDDAVKYLPPLKMALDAEIVKKLNESALRHERPAP